MPSAKKSTLTAPPLLTLSAADVEGTKKALKEKTFVPWYPTATAAPAAPTRETSKTYSFRDETSTLQEVHCAEERAGSRCFWCLRPVALGTGRSIPTERTLNTYRKMGTFCGHNRYKCAYAWLLREIDRPVRRRDVAFINSVSLLHALFREEHPGRVMVPAAEYSLLASNGGEYDDAAWDDLTSDAFYHSGSSDIAIGKITTNVAHVACGNAPVLYPATDPMFPALKGLVY